MKIKYPETKRRRRMENIHGRKVVDEYRWLENLSDPEVIKWIKSQNGLSKGYFDKIKLKTKLYKEIENLSDYDEMSIPQETFNGNKIFYFKREKSQQKWIYYMKNDWNSDEEVLIDPNKWGEQESLSYVVPSLDGRYVAYGKESGGDENPVLFILDTDSREILLDKVTGWKQTGVTWLPDNSGFYYSRLPNKGDVPEGQEYYWTSVYFHKVGTDSSEDEYIFGHKKVKEYFHFSKNSSDGKYLIFNRTTFDKSEIFYKDSNGGKLIKLIDGMDADYEVDIVNGFIFILTNKDSPNRKIFVSRTDAPELENWKEIVPEGKNKIESINLINSKLIVTYLKDAENEIIVFDFEGKKIDKVELPDRCSSVVGGKYNKDYLWVMFSSFSSPWKIYKYKFSSELEEYFIPKISISEDIITEKIWYKSKDGTPISMFIIKGKNFKRKTHTLLTGYGGFNVSMIPIYTPSFVAWIKSGGIVAVPNLRGGGEYGENWHEMGKGKNKQNVFDDFISAAEFLIENSYCDASKLAIMGGSNGGLLVGAALVQKPKLFRAVVCSVPLLDMVRYHKFGLANVWSEEYGSSEKKDDFEYLYSYSPYHNAKQNDYPSVLFMTSENDSRVHPMHAFKMTAKLQFLNTSDNLILLTHKKSSGHGGGTTINSNIERKSEELSFLLNELGIKEI